MTGGAAGDGPGLVTFAAAVETSAGSEELLDDASRCWARRGYCCDRPLPGYRARHGSGRQRISWHHIAVLCVVVAMAAVVIDHLGRTPTPPSARTTAMYPSAASDSALLAVADGVCPGCMHAGLLSAIPDSLLAAAPDLRRINGYELRCTESPRVDGIVLHAFSGRGVSLLFVAVNAASASGSRVAPIVGVGLGAGISTVSATATVMRSPWRMVSVVTSGSTKGLRLPMFTAWMRGLVLPKSRTSAGGRCG